MLKSPDKAKALREDAELQHSRSSTDLRGERRHDGIPQGISSKSRAPQIGRRPGAVKLRRRSTRNWADIPPLERQRKLENATKDRLADVFFTLHTPKEESPIYISEIVAKAMNPDFQAFDLQQYGPSITRLDSVIVKIWTKTTAAEGFQLLVEWKTQLRALTFLSKTLDSFHHPLPVNCVVFHLTDGVYTNFVDAPDIHDNKTSKLHRNTYFSAQSTSSYAQLMHLATLDACIQDALATRDRIKLEIETVLQKNRQKFKIIESVPESTDRLKNVRNSLAAMKKEVSFARRRKREIELSIKERKYIIESGRKTIEEGEKEMDMGSNRLESDKNNILRLEDDLTGQRRRVCEEILQIFPIEPVERKQLAFTIRGLFLPDSDFNHCDANEIAAALGYVTQVVQLLQLYLHHTVPYPVNSCGSTSTIDDPISNTTGPRTYPLFLKGTVRYRFDYGVFLLNKDIEILANFLGLRLLDIRQTIPNLKYLLYVATAGKGELPARKAGGVRGLRAPAKDCDGSGLTNTSHVGEHSVPELPIVEGKGISSGETGMVYKNKISVMPTSSRLREIL